MSAGLLLVTVLAQAPGVPGADASLLERIRKGIADTPAMTTTPQPDDTGNPVFRVKVESWRFAGPPWDPKSIVPSYVRPTMPLAHYEYLFMVNPEGLRASTLYHPIFSVTFDPVIVRNFFARRHRAAEERRAREKVARDLEALRRAGGDGRYLLHTATLYWSQWTSPGSGISPSSRTSTTASRRSPIVFSK